MIDWEMLEEILYDSMDSMKENWSPNEREYLCNSYHEIEKLWEGNVSQIANPKIILIGESPLYGDEENYIYSKETPQSAFLAEWHFDDDAKGKGSKPGLLNRMIENGIVVIDAFPYALNKDSTRTMDYDKMPRTVYKRLLRKVFRNYTKVKINGILEKNPNAKIVIRYKRTYDSIMSELEKHGFGSKEIPCISKQGGMVNKELFRCLLLQAE